MPHMAFALLALTCQSHPQRHKQRTKQDSHFSRPWDDGWGLTSTLIQSDVIPLVLALWALLKITRALLIHKDHSRHVCQW